MHVECVSSSAVSRISFRTTLQTKIQRCRFSFIGIVGLNWVIYPKYLQFKLQIEIWIAIHCNCNLKIIMNTEDKKKNKGKEKWINVTPGIPTAQTQWYCKERCIYRGEKSKRKTDLTCLSLHSFFRVIPILQLPFTLWVKIHFWHTF